MHQLLTIEDHQITTDRSGFGRLICGLSLCRFRFSRCLRSRFLFSLSLQGCLFALLSFLGFLHLKTLLDLLLLLCRVKDILNCAGRALGSAQAALDALLGIDNTEVIVDRDRAFRADSCALSASDAGCSTCFSGVRAFLLVVAADLDFSGLRDDLDQLLRARLCAGTAACAVVTSYNCYAVNDADRVKFTGLYAVAQTDTSVRALFAAAEQLLGSLTGIDIFIFIELCSVVRCAVAHYKRDLFLHTSGILSQKGGELGSYCGTADRTLGAGSFPFAFCHGVCIIVTSCISASAAVRSGELCAKIEEKLVFLNRKHL